MNGTNRDRGRIGLIIFLVVLSIILTPIPGTIDDEAAAAIEEYQALKRLQFAALLSTNLIDACRSLS